jgi:DNA primase
MPPHPGPPGQAGDRDDDRRAKLGALRDQLHQAAQALRTAGDWAACLSLAARLPGQDWGNILLIGAQRPGATRLGDYKQWTAAGRQVRKGETGIAVFAIPPPPRRAQRPGDDDDDPPEPATWRDAGRVRYLWDLAQTTGPPGSRDAPGAPRDPPGQVRDALSWLARRLGYAVEEEHGPPDGAVFWAARRIRIPPQLSDEQAVQALAHQLGHVLLHHDPDHPPPPGTTTAGCTGLRKAEADSIAWITCARHGITPAGTLSYPASWAGTDPRAQPAAAILAAGHRITTVAARITAHTVRTLHGDDPAPSLTASPGPAAQARPPAASQRETAAPQASTPVTQPAASPPPRPDAAVLRVLADACAFYTSQLDGSWAAAYLETRGITPAAIRDWGIGYAPAGWTTLTDHLRRLGHHDDMIQAAGLATRSSRGTLIDRFRDRVILPVHDAGGLLAGFTGRARPDAGPDVPKYLNSPETAVYKKSHLLFGLHQARPALAQGAVPVLAEGPFDAIAVTIADPGRHAGLAPCGTALTSQQAALLDQAADLDRTGIIVAFDSDDAGRKAAIRAHGILRPHTANLQYAELDGKDPAEIMQRDGPQALRRILGEHRQPLSALLLDATIGQWARRMDDIDGPLLAMRATAALIASLLPDGIATQIRAITAGRELQTTDDMLRPVDNPEIPQIAAILPAETTYQTVRAAAKLGFDVTDVLAEVANAATSSTASPGHQPSDRHVDRGRSRDSAQPTAARLASTSFPHPPLTPHTGPAPAAQPAMSAKHLRPARLAR